MNIRTFRIGGIHPEENKLTLLVKQKEGEPLSQSVELDKIEGVKQIDSLHCDVDMRYVDKGCYDDAYTLKLLKENGEWRIDDVVYSEGNGTLRDDLKTFYVDMEETYRTTSPEEIMEFMLSEEPLEENYTDPESIFYKNPKAVLEVIDGIKCCHELFMKNPGYTVEYGQQIDEMVNRIAAHI